MTTTNTGIDTYSVVNQYSVQCLLAETGCQAIKVAWLCDFETENGFKFSSWKEVQMALLPNGEIAICAEHPDCEECDHNKW